MKPTSSQGESALHHNLAMAGSSSSFPLFRGRAFKWLCPVMANWLQEGGADKVGGGRLHFNDLLMSKPYIRKAQKYELITEGGIRQPWRIPSEHHPAGYGVKGAGKTTCNRGVERTRGNLGWWKTSCEITEHHQVHHLSLLTSSEYCGSGRHNQKYGSIMSHTPRQSGENPVELPLCKAATRWTAAAEG